MSTTTIYIIIAIVVILSIYFTIMTRWYKKRKQSQLEYFHKTHSNKPLTQDQKQILVYGAILAYNRGEAIFGLVPEKGTDQYIYGLKYQWNITNHKTAVETLTELAQLKRSSQFDVSINSEDRELIKIKKAVAKALGIDLQDVMAVGSTYAWDTCRLVSLSKWSYWAGFINEEQMWYFMKFATNLAREKGKDWQDYTISFLLGRTIQGFDLSIVDIGTKQLYHSKNPVLGTQPDIDVYQKYPFK